MQNLRLGRAVARAAALVVTAVFGLSLAACNGGSNSVPGITTNNGYFRFVNGSADAGAVDVYVDGQKVAAPSGGTGTYTYGSIGAYNSFSTGSHTITVNAAGSSTALVTATQSLNAGQYESLILSGESHPANGAGPLGIVAMQETNLFNTGSGNMAVNFHNAATPLGTATVGYFFTNTPSQQSQLAQIPVGNESLQGIPSSALNASIAVGFYATGGATTITETPSQVDPNGCTANTLPCNSGNLSLYLIDGPAASTTPSAGPYPQGITATQKASMVGIFDQNGV